MQTCFPWRACLLKAPNRYSVEALAAASWHHVRSAVRLAYGITLGRQYALHNLSQCSGILCTQTLRSPRGTPIIDTKRPLLMLRRSSTIPSPGNTEPDHATQL